MDLPAITAALRRGDAAAQAEIVDRFYPPVCRAVHLQLQRDYRRHHPWILPLFSTGDIVQEVFLSALRDQLDGFEGGDEQALVQYLAAIVRHRLVDAVRYHQAARRDVRRRQPSEADASVESSAELPAAPDQTPSLAAAMGEQLAIYRAVMDALPERDRELLVRRIEHQESFAEIAAARNLPTADAARQACRAARARLLVRLRARGLQPTDFEVHGDGR